MSFMASVISWASDSRFQIPMRGNEKAKYIARVRAHREFQIPMRGNERTGTAMSRSNLPRSKSP